jgi:acyl dehydratase
VIVRSVTLNQHGEDVQVFTAKIIVFKRPVDANPSTRNASVS